jgi:hypothetical protein
MGVSPKYTLDDCATKKLMLVPLCCVQNWCTFQDGISDGAFSIPGLWGVPKVYLCWWYFMSAVCRVRIRCTSPDDYSDIGSSIMISYPLMAALQKR